MMMLTISQAIVPVLHPRFGFFVVSVDCLNTLLLRYRGRVSRRHDSSCMIHHCGIGRFKIISQSYNYFRKFLLVAIILYLNRQLNVSIFLHTEMTYVKVDGTISACE